MDVSAVDLFCGIGGLTHGLIKAGIPVNVGMDTDSSCKYAFEKNNNAKFIEKDIKDVDIGEIKKFYSKDSVKVLVGCAPCQPFSTHTQKIKDRKKDERWGMLYNFLDIIKGVQPEIVSMENVPQITKYDVFTDFVAGLESEGYYVFWEIVNCPDYGIPQTRRRLVLLASKLGEIDLVPKTHEKKRYKTVMSAIGVLDPIEAGEVHPKDPMHKSYKLSPINSSRIRQSKPGGTWWDWDEELRLRCHKKDTGESYKAVYGRMLWDGPGPTITTQFYNLGTGRFGHPEQDRALTLREGALLQTFPKKYVFAKTDEEITFKKTGAHIGNAVPVRLGMIIGKSILRHLEHQNNG